MAADLFFRKTKRLVVSPLLLKVVKKLGFRKEGLSKRVVFIRGDWQDLVQYALTCEDRGIKWQGTVEVRKK